MNQHQEEQLRIGKIMDIIRRSMEEFSQKVGEVKENVVDIRKHFWEDVTINVGHTDDRVETYISVKQQAELLSERERSLALAERQYSKLGKLLNSPYFGRIDFIEKGSSAAESIYLGIASLLDENGEQFLIYDWRAPISSLYYDYGPGPAEYDTPSGKISGTMELKRQFLIRGGQIQLMFDTTLTIGDEILQQVLGQGADSQMKTIVATIQREQNRMIRNDSNRMLIVSGPAGSGKTSAALQRVAYLLYKYRSILSADQIVLFSPNPMFNRYVSTVLPELGEENMEQTTLHEYLLFRLSNQFALEDPFSQLEYVLTRKDEQDYDARIESISFKSSAAYLDVIDRFKQSLERGGVVFKPIKLRGRTLLSAEQISEKFYSLASVVKLAPRISLLVEWMEKELEALVLKERDKAWVLEEMELLDKEDYQKVFNSLSRERRMDKGAFNEGQRESVLLQELVLHRHLRRLRARVKKLKFIDLPATYRSLFDSADTLRKLMDPADVPSSWPDICRITRDKLDNGELLYEDATPYLYLQELIEGFHVNMHIRHVFVDEVQDYSLFQLEFIKRLFPRSRMTVLGDLNQSINAHSSLPGFERLTGLYGPDASEIIRLSKTYRSTKPIVEFTRSMLKDGRDFEPFNREGELPVVCPAPNERELQAKIAQKIRELQEESLRTIAVICKTAHESRAAYDALHALSDIPLKLITKETTTFESGVVVIPSYLAKGIEFDAVIIYNGSKTVYERETERLLFYTACTRAMHRLSIFYTGDMSPFIASAEPSTYTQAAPASMMNSDTI